MGPFAPPALGWERREGSGEKVTSYGYNAPFSQTEDPILGKYNRIANREIVDVGLYRITTSFNFPPGPSSGACGRPLLNRAGQVTGMHCGSRNFKLSFAISQTALEDLLRTYYAADEGRALKIKGVEVGRIYATQKLASIEVYFLGKRIRATDVSSYFGPFDCGELEKLMEFSSDDEVILTLEGHNHTVSEILYKVP